MEILFNSVSLNNTLIVSCLQPRSLAGVKKWTITDCIPLEKLVKKPTFDEHSARLLCFTKRIQIIKEHKRKNEWNNFTTKLGLDLFCLAFCAGDYYFHKQNKKTCFYDDAFDVSYVFFSWQRAGLSQVRQNYIAKDVLE